MKRSLCLTLILLPLLTGAAFAAAPVIDESENYALLEDQASREAPVTPTSALPPEETFTHDEEIALAQEDAVQAPDVDLLNKIKGLQQDIQVLRGQLEEQTHALKKLQEQQLAFYKDIDARLSTGGKSANASPSPKTAPLNLDTVSTSSNSKIITPIPTPHNKNPAEEQVSYLAAYDLVKTKQFDEALTAMQVFVNQYPRGGYTANAHYWLGELYLIKKQYPEAIDHFQIVLKQFPNSSKKAACSLKIGYALAASGQTAEAKKHLQQVIKNYPATPAAQLAEAKLRALNV